MSSHVSGVEDSRRLRAADRPDKDAGEVTIALEHARWRQFAWALFGCVLGPLFIFGLGGAGTVVGSLVLIGGLVATRAFLRTLLHPAGTVIVRGDELELPVKLCSGQSVTVKLDDVRHAYLIRKSVPWTTSGPLLVIETRGGAFEYPRDWFARDDDQREVMRVVNRRLRH